MNFLNHAYAPVLTALSSFKNHLLGDEAIPSGVLKQFWKASYGELKRLGPLREKSRHFHRCQPCRVVHFQYLQIASLPVQTANYSLKLFSQSQGSLPTLESSRSIFSVCATILKRPVTTVEQTTSERHSGRGNSTLHYASFRDKTQERQKTTRLFSASAFHQTRLDEIQLTCPKPLT